MGKLKNLLRELRHRRVFRMTAIYIVAAWVGVQVASEVFPAFNIPEGAIRYVWVAVLIGFPIAVFFSWKYDFTTSGIRRTPGAHEDMATVHTLTRVDYSILAAMGLVTLAIVFGVGQRLIEVQTETARLPTTREIDLQQRTLAPGFRDAHFHFLQTGLKAAHPSLGGCRSLDDVHDAVRDGVSRFPDRAPLVFEEWDETQWTVPQRA